MIKGTTQSGFAFEIDEKKLNDMEFVDALAELEEDGTALSKVVKMMFDSESKKRLYNHVRTEEGRVPVDSIGKEIRDIFKVAAEKSEEVKNC